MARSIPGSLPQIVISYHVDDEAWAARLISHLQPAEEAKYEIWLDAVHANTRGQVEAAIVAALETAKVVVLLISPSYVDSTWVDSEEGARLLARFSAGPNVVGVIVHNLEKEQLYALPSFYVPVAATPLTETTAEAAEAILRKLVTLVGLLIEGKSIAGTRSQRDEPVLTIEELARFAWSDEVENALRLARKLATISTLIPVAVTTPSLLFGLAEAGRAEVEYFRTPQFLLKELTNRGEDVYTRALFGAFPGLGNLGEQAGRTIDSLSEDADVVTPNVIRVFQLAEMLARQTMRAAPPTSRKDTAVVLSPPYIGARHLLAALLVLNPEDGPSGARWHLSRIVSDVVALRKRFFNFIVKSLPDDDHEAWQTILIDLKLPDIQTGPLQRPNSTRREPFPPPTVAGFMADNWTGRDLLGIERDVNALASLVAAYKVEPPLSIGLFGDWGSGKSHFMRQMRKRVELLSTSARASGKPQNELGYYKNIVQIEFNAWHYIEGNLWASLVDHIFANLKLSEREDPTYAEQRRDELMQKLGVKEDIQKKINLRVQDREKELDKLNERTLQAEAELDKASTQLQGFKEEARASLEKLSVPVAFTDEEKELLGRLGIDAGTEISAADVRNNYLKLKSGWSGLKARWRLFRTDPRAKRRYLLSVVLAAIPIAGALLVWMKAFPGLPTTVATILGCVAAGYVATKPAWDQFRKSLRALEKHDEEIERKLQQRIGQLKSEATALTNEIVNTKLERETVFREVEQLKADIQNTTSRTILAEFIEDRAAATDYRRHLGLLALIRRDFEKMRDLFDQQRQEEVDGKPTADEKRINRIVLYIDDLDRCPPDRVVQVLQAIHLLLAFPLFVVVVGVDSRWITRSLQQSYEWLQAADEIILNNGTEKQEKPSPPRAGATPHDYLEKIFQIPFWLRPMNHDACIELLDGLTKDASDHKQQMSRPEQLPTSIEKPATTETPAQPEVSLVDETGNMIRTDQPLSLPPQLEHTEPARVFENRENDPDRPELSPRSLTFTSYETEYMRKLVPLIGRSPRAVKRFLNCYRLIKVGLAPEEFTDFVGENGVRESYKAVMILLAVIIGAPGVVSYALEEMTKSDIATMQPLVSVLESKPEIRQHPEGERLIAFFTTHDSVGPSLRKELRKYAPRVARFSFNQPG